MAPGERAAMVTIVLYPDRVVLRHLLVNSGFYTHGRSHRGQGLGSKIGAAVLAAYGHLPIDVWFDPDQSDPGLTAERLPRLGRAARLPARTLIPRSSTGCAGRC